LLLIGATPPSHAGDVRISEDDASLFGADGEFVAEEVLAKHDENYMAPEVAAALERAKQP
jgi:hypothetical protein